MAQAVHECDDFECMADSAVAFLRRWVVFELLVYARSVGGQGGFLTGGAGVGLARLRCGPVALSAIGVWAAIDFRVVTRMRPMEQSLRETLAAKA